VGGGEVRDGKEEDFDGINRINRMQKFPSIPLILSKGAFSESTTSDFRRDF
jgi:hypothetical protein